MRVFAEDAEGNGSEEVMDAVCGELRKEGALGIEVAVAGDGEGGKERKARESGGGGGKITDAEAVIEAAETGAVGDDILRRNKVAWGGVGWWWCGPVAVDCGADHPIIGEVVVNLIGGYHG